MWLSNFKENSPLYFILKNRRNGILFKGISSYQIVCDSNITRWLINQKHKIRKNYLQAKKNEEKLKIMYSNIKVEIKDVTESDLETLLKLQDKRSKNSSTLNSLSGNKEFVNFLFNCISSNIFKIINLKVSGKTISSLLINFEFNSISIFIQGFDDDFKIYSPSKILIANLIDFAHNNKYKYIDFLRGDENYKRNICNSEIQLFKYIEFHNYKMTHNTIEAIKNFEE